MLLEVVVLEDRRCSCAEDAGVVDGTEEGGDDDDDDDDALWIICVDCS